MSAGKPLLEVFEQAFHQLLSIVNTMDKLSLRGTPACRQAGFRAPTI
jgi:hypothetical protein